MEETVYGFYQKLCVCGQRTLYILLTLVTGYAYGGGTSSLYIGAQFHIQKYGSSSIEFFMVTHNAIPFGGVPVWMINASIMESMDCSDQNTEPKMFLGAQKKLTETSAVSQNVQIREEMTKLMDGSSHITDFLRIPNKPAFGWKWSVGIIGSRKITIGFVLTILKEVRQFSNY